MKNKINQPEWLCIKIKVLSTALSGKDVRITKWTDISKFWISDLSLQSLNQFT